MQIVPILLHSAELPETAGERLFCPAFAGHPPDRAEYLALLPVQDSNGRLLAALAELAEGVPEGVPEGVCVGVLAVDPFRPAGPFLESLRRAGVRAVANFPTTALFDGETGETLRGVGLGAEREASFLAQAAQAGFAVTGFAADAATGRRLRAAGASRLVVHPGAATGDPSRDAEAAANASMTAATLRREGGGPVLVYRPAGFEEHHGILAREADGLVLLPSKDHSSSP
ncbi:phosphoenolpyruvate hydrolase family protein [Roseomonas genomospecies 6]|uniref:phosphoenolpyruvate hydrolase family protein n=1 Tax=Roseomonas genomospecies 6 TaxID=214106 RepID=UPI00142EA79E|nr:phosphoenolpyruvate hydrolase family protein [Roseomonas genomospecies 6]